MSGTRHEDAFGPERRGLLKAGILRAVLAPLLWASAIVFCETLRPGYSHFAQYISDLGERGSSTELLMHYAAFVPKQRRSDAAPGKSRRRERRAAANGVAPCRFTRA